MYKWKKEEAQKEVVDPEIVYAEKSGYYCDLCGELIEEDTNKAPTYYGHNPRIRDAFQRVTNPNDFVPINTILPRVEIRSITGSKTVDLCPKCESEIMNKIASHSGKVIENLIRTSRSDIIFAQAHKDRDHEEIVRLRAENANMHTVLDALAYRND